MTEDKKKLELKKTENIDKKEDHYVHTIEVIYPNINVENMLKSWNETVEKQNDWLSKYDEFVEEAKKSAEQAVDVTIQQKEDEITKLLAMSDEEKLEYWKKNFAQVVEQHNKDKEKRDELIETQFKTNKELLDKYKVHYEHEMKLKQEAIKKWTV